MTAIFTGMRASELRGLRWSDIDLAAGTIHVRQRADAWMTLGPTKSEAGKRDIPLAPMVINALTALIDARAGVISISYSRTVAATSRASKTFGSGVGHQCRLSAVCSRKLA